MRTLTDLGKLIAAHKHARANLPPLSPEALRAQADAVEARIKELWATPVLPTDGAIVAVAPNAPKTAALFFDRVWFMPGFEETPLEIAAYGATPFEIWALALFALAPDLSFQLADECLPGNPVSSRFRLLELVAIDDLPVRALAESLQEVPGVVAMPIYNSVSARAQEYKPGKREVLVAALANLGVPHEESLTWEQVVEFRSDGPSRAAYRRMIHWADKELVGKPMSYVEDELAVRLEAYTRSVKKHGIKTALGTLEVLVKPESLLAGSVAAGTALGLGLGTVGSIFSGLATLGANVAISMAKERVNLDDVMHSETAEIAYVYQLVKIAPPPC